MSDPVELELVACPEASRIARRVVASRLHRWQRADDLDSVLLVVSELVSNAVRHGIPPLRLEVECRPRSIMVSVFDAGAPIDDLVDRGWPATDELSGRGLAIVAALSESWGVVDESPGKTVWSEVAVTSR